LSVDGLHFLPHMRFWSVGTHSGVPTQLLFSTVGTHFFVSVGGVVEVGGRMQVGSVAGLQGLVEVGGLVGLEGNGLLSTMHPVLLSQSMHFCPV
jgi:hypothetical protein